MMAAITTIDPTVIKNHLNTKISVIFFFIIIFSGDGIYKSQITWMKIKVRKRIETTSPLYQYW